ncbi:MAG: hypothetical protein ACK46X_17770 [Candidatus Sericytochromatia bacterium]
MSQVTIGSKTLDASVIKIRRGEELLARETAQRDGMDNTFFQLGEDTFVASGLATHIHGLKNGTDVTFNGKKGTVISSNNEQDAQSDLWVTGGITAAVTAMAVGGAIVGGGALAFILAPVLGLFTLGIGGSFTYEVYRNRQTAKENLIAKHGTPVA